MPARTSFIIVILLLTLIFGLNLPTGQASLGATAGFDALVGAEVITPDATDAAVTTLTEPEFPLRLGEPLTLTGKLVFQSDRAGSFDVYTQTVVGGTAVPVIAGAQNNVTPVWSPDGSQIVFASDRSGNYDIYMRTAAGQEVNLTQHSAEDIHPSWSPDGQKIIFSSNRGGSYFQIYTMNANGSNVQQVGIVLDNNAVYPRYSPDGNRIAFMRATTTAPLCEWNWDIWLMNASGGQQQQLTSSYGADLYPEWSPDGSKVIFASCRNFLYFNLYTIQPSDKVEQQVTNWFLSSEWAATFSPDGQYIAFNSNYEGNTEIYVATPAGTNSFNLTQHHANEMSPSWTTGAGNGDLCEGATSLPPILLVTGWQGSKKSLAEDDQLYFFEQWLGAHGYRLDCNLFYAKGTSAKKFLLEHAAILKDENLCEYYEPLSVRYSGWAGEFDIIAYSYGGLRARAYLESDLYSSGCGQDKPIHVHNLFTVGTPHGGEFGDLPFAAYIGLAAIQNGQWPALWEMLPPVRLYQNLAQQQNGETCYRMLSGDGRLQAATQPTLLMPIYYKWPPAQKLPNDFAVHQLSAHALLFLFWQYPRSTYIFTPDLHGQVPGYIDPLQTLRSYVNPKSTFEQTIIDQLGSRHCPLLLQANETLSLSDYQKPVMTLLAELNEPQLNEMPPLQDIAAGTLTGSSSVTGQFQMGSSQSSQIMMYWDQGNVSLTLSDPQGNVMNSQNAGSNPNVDYLHLDTGFGLMTSYMMTNTLTGTWNYTITAQTLTEPSHYRLMAVLSKPIAVSGSVPAWVPNNTPLVMTATVTYSSTIPVPGGTVTARIQRPDNVIHMVTLFDNGQHQDGLPGDGVFGATYSQANKGGIYGVLLTATGTHQSETYSRSGTTFFTVAPTGANLTGMFTSQGVDQNNNNLYEWLEVTVGLTVTEATTYTLAAELYAGNDFVAHTNKSVYLTAGSRTVALRFDGDTIYRRGLNGPYSVRTILLLNESPVTLLVEAVADAHTTAAYHYSQFGHGRETYLPFIRR
jgi:TolB protein